MRVVLLVAVLFGTSGCIHFVIPSVISNLATYHQMNKLDKRIEKLEGKQ